MTTPTVKKFDFYFCGSGEAHAWEYRGKQAQSYRCRRCSAAVSKADLKGNTD